MAQYKKYFDIGTYTGNGGQYRVGMPTLRSPGASNGQVAQSLRFRSSNANYLNKTFGAAGNRQKMTYSFWMKRTPGNGGYIYCVDWSGSGASQGFATIRFASDQLIVSNETSNAYDWYYQTTMKFLDASRWYHIVVAIDTTQATAANRVIIYVDNVILSTFAGSSVPSQNYSTKHNGTALRIGEGDNGGALYAPWDGYLAEVNFVDGTQLTPSSFGEYNSDNIWVPKAYTGTYGTNGYYLKFAPGAVGTDSSGNGNNWTVNSFQVTVANTQYDIVTDSPVDYGTDTGAGAEVKGNYCTFNPNDKSGNITLTEGNLTVTSAANQNAARATIGVSSGKWYWEVKAISTNFFTGVSRYNATTGGIPGYNDSLGWMWGQVLGTMYYYQNGAQGTGYGSVTAANDIIGVALNMDAGQITYYINGVSQGVSSLTPSGTVFPTFCQNNATSVPSQTYNFGQRAFSFAAPSGYKALCTANISRPTDSSLWFNGESPDFMWIKNRSTTGYHVLTDTVRGMGLHLYTNNTGAEGSGPALTEMNKFGMTVLNEASVLTNGSTNSHVYWGWKAAGPTTVTNTNGTLTSQVSTNPSTGFSIVKYTGTGTAGTVGHGLGATPQFIIHYNRAGGYSWRVYHASMVQSSYTPYSGYISMDTTGFNLDTSGAWNNTAPTSSVFSIGNGAQVNSSGGNYIAYCWTSIPGYSAFGNYTGNASTDGPFVYLGFRPKVVIFKRTDSTGDWLIIDSVRDSYNPTNVAVYPELSNAEGTGWNIDYLSNGFKMRFSGPNLNGSGGTYVYAAFAESPFKFARAR